MGNKFASGKHSIAMCDRCGQQFKLKKLRTEVIKTKRYNLLVCDECWDPDHPQLLLGMFPVDDPQAVRNPRRDTTYVTAGVNVFSCCRVLAGEIPQVDRGTFNGDGTRLVVRQAMTVVSRPII